MAGVLPSLFGGPTRGKSILSFAVGLGGLGLPVENWPTHQASFYVFRHVLLHARPVCYLLECFIGGLGAVGVLRMVHRGRVSASSPFGREGLRALA